MKEQAAGVEVIIVGAGPSGLATAACLSLQSIPYVILERENCYASIWKKYSYDRLRLHLAKQFCQLPHLPFPSSYPMFVSRAQFIEYLDHYVSHFNIVPSIRYQRSVESASYDEATNMWNVKASNLLSPGRVIEEYYSGRFLVVASGETSNPFTPDIRGLSSFCSSATGTGEVIHSTQYKNGKPYGGKNVLVVGSGNSGMEIALDLANHAAKTSLVIRSPVHVLSREMVYLGLVLLRYVPCGGVDTLMVMLSRLVYGDLSKYGIHKPREGPFFMKAAYGKYPVIDAGTCEKIKSGQIQGDDSMLNDDGIPKQSYPNHWKGKNGLYCVGLSRKGLYGAAADAQNIADHINSILSPLSNGMYTGCVDHIGVDSTRDAKIPVNLEKSQNFNQGGLGRQAQAQE
ncbi:hypothetical protein WN943_017082 [Citrus x changshan-huyou]